MKNKALLPLMEQLIMILVFALTAALCLQGFALASKASHRQENANLAALKLQNAAELLKSSSGDFSAAALQLCGTLDDSSILVSYDSRWQTVSSGDTGVNFLLKITPVNTGTPFLGSAHIALYEVTGSKISSEDQPLFELTTAWQIPAAGGDGT